MTQQAAMIRCDASLSVGTGHVVRCLALAGVLRSRGWRVTFAAREMPAPLRGEIERAGHDLILMGGQHLLEAEPLAIRRAVTDPPLLVVVDHYGVDRAWEMAMADVTPHLMAIDDLAEQPHAVSILLNQNLGYSPTEYDGLIAAGSSLLMGPGYALLRPQFSAARESAPRVRDSVQRILVFISGSDPHDVTGLAARAAAGTGVQVDVVTGGAYPFSSGLETWAHAMTNVTVHHNVAEMATLMLGADLSVGAPSSASWERCCLGLPTLLIGVAENQRRVANALAEVGAAQHLGWYDEVREADIVSAIEHLRSDPSRLASMSRAAAAVTDGRGAERVADVIQSTVLRVQSPRRRDTAVTSQPSDVTLRPLSLADIIRVREWRNLPEVARYMYTDHEISEAEHASWFGKALDSPDRRYWIIELDGNPVGLANLYDIDTTHRRAYWGLYLADPAVRGRGVGSATERFLLRYAFQELGLNKVCCEALGSNAAAIASYRKSGFAVDGTLRSHIWKRDRFEDVVALSILAEEWKAQQP